MSSCYTTNTGVHLTQLIIENVKVSIHALKLCQDDLQGHITKCQRRRSKGGRNSKNYRTSRLHTWQLWSELSLAPSNRTSVDGTHNGEVRRARNGDGKVAKDKCDSRRKDELIKGHCILKDIKDRSDEVRGEVNGEVL